MQMNSELNSDFEKKKLFQNFVPPPKKHFFPKHENSTFPTICKTDFETILL